MLTQQEKINYISSSLLQLEKIVLLKVGKTASTDKLLK